MFRWYTKHEYKWYWDSRYDSWYKSCSHNNPILQYLKNGKWVTVPSVVEEITPQKPKD